MENKRIKDLTIAEALDVCHNANNCLTCPLNGVICGYCINSVDYWRNQNLDKFINEPKLSNKASAILTNLACLFGDKYKSVLIDNTLCTAVHPIVTTPHDQLYIYPTIFDNELSIGTKIDF